MRDIVTSEIDEWLDAAGLDLVVDTGGVLLPPGMQGMYLPKRAGIIVARGLSPVDLRCVVAHELGHHWYGHEACEWEWLAAKHELQAERYAAKLLISEEAYREAEERYGGNIVGIAYALGVRKSLVEVFRGMIRR